MQIYPVLRNSLLLLLAATFGWWMRGANAPVLAQHTRDTDSDALAFQMIGTGPDSTLALYNRQNHQLYIYARTGAGASTVPCTYSFLITEPGLPLQRANCPAGQLR